MRSESVSHNAWLDGAEWMNHRATQYVWQLIPVALRFTFLVSRQWSVSFFFCFQSFDVFNESYMRLFCIFTSTATHMTSFSPQKAPWNLNFIRFRVFMKFYSDEKKRSTTTEKNCNKFGWTSKIHERRNAVEKERRNTAPVAWWWHEMQWNPLRCTFHFYRIFQRSLLHEHLSYRVGPRKLIRAWTLRWMAKQTLKCIFSNIHSVFAMVCNCSQESKRKNNEIPTLNLNRAHLRA